MAEQNKNAQEQDLNKLLKVRREKLAELQENGKEGCPWCAEGRRVRHPHGRDLPSLVWHVHPAVQESEGLEKRKPS